MLITSPPNVQAPDSLEVLPPQRKELKTPVSCSYVYRYSEFPSIDDIILSVTNGLDASFIDPELFPSIFPALSYEEHRLRTLNPVGAAQIRRALKFMSEWKPIETGKRLQRKREVIPPSDAEINEAVDVAMNSDDLSGIEERTLPYMLPRLKEIQNHALREKTYKIAEKADIGLKRVMSQPAIREKLAREDERAAYRAKEISKAETQLMNIKETWEMRIERKKKENQEDIKQMKLEFQEELKEFDAFAREDPPPQRMKLSSTILDMREKQKHLLTSKRFREAGELQKEIDILEKNELAKKEQEWKDLLMEERENMIKKHKERVDIKKENLNIAMTKMRMSATEDIRRAKKVLDTMRIRDLKQRSARSPQLPQLVRRQ